MRQTFGLLLAFAWASTNAHAQDFPEGFDTGPLIKDYGPAANVEGRQPIPADTAFRISFDVGKQAEPGALNRSLVSAARFLNMHAEAGVPAENMSLAFVIHGKAVHDVTRDAHYRAQTDAGNANTDLIKALLDNGVTIEVCGQSAAYYGVGVDDLLPGVTMSLSAMTSHAILQQKGYTLNPF